MPGRAYTRASARARVAAGRAHPVEDRVRPDPVPVAAVAVVAVVAAPEGLSNERRRLQPL